MNMKQLSCDIVYTGRFISAVRDSGYNHTSSALAELIDNSIEAGARTIQIRFEKLPHGDVTVAVLDDGDGMKRSVLQSALQFGGTSRFNCRSGVGRFGMGLPNSSLSQAKRVEVTSWTSRTSCWRTHLDVDEVVSGQQQSLGVPQRVPSKIADTSSGTLVVWKKCDRLSYKNESAFLASIRISLGRIFRNIIDSGVHLSVNGETVVPIDPLFRNKRYQITSQPYGPRLEYEVLIPTFTNKPSTVTVQFVTLPLNSWHSLTNDEKEARGISKGAGVSILRAGREIDYGWYFMGHKRKENYDDWWRCEIGFEPELDELFGVTNTKQGIRPVRELNELIVPDIESIARTLNQKVRKEFGSLGTNTSTAGTRIAEKRDHFLEPPQGSVSRPIPSSIVQGPRPEFSLKRSLNGLKYRFETSKELNGTFFSPIIECGTLIVRFDENHPFFRNVFKTGAKNVTAEKLHQIMELVVLAAGRAEMGTTAEEQQIFRRLREKWSKVLATFLE